MSSCVWSARSSVWHLLLELQASALELLLICKSQKNLQIQNMWFQKNSKKKIQNLTHLFSGAASCPAENLIPNRGLTLGSPVFYHQHRRTADHRRSPIVVLLAGCPWSPVYSVASNSGQRVSEHDMQRMQRALQVFRSHHSYHFDQGEDPPVHPGYKKDGEGVDSMEYIS